MKKQRLFTIALLCAIFLISFNSCSDKDDTEPQSQAQQESPALDVKTVAPPEAMTQSSDPGAQMAASYISIANSFSGFAGMMMPPPTKSGQYKSTLDGEPWIYTWDFSEGTDVYTLTLTIIETATEYSWTMVINGTLDGLVLTDFLYMEAAQALDGTSGEFIMYDPEEQGIGMMTSWLTSSNGTYSLTFEVPGDVKIVLTTNLDNSGEISVYDWYDIEYLLSFNAIWDSSGHGEWFEYYMGVLEDQGVW